MLRSAGSPSGSGRNSGSAEGPGQGERGTHSTSIAVSPEPCRATSGPACVSPETPNSGLSPSEGCSCLARACRPRPTRWVSRARRRGRQRRGAHRHHERRRRRAQPPRHRPYRHAGHTRKSLAHNPRGARTDRPATARQLEHPVRRGRELGRRKSRSSAGRVEHERTARYRITRNGVQGGGRWDQNDHWRPASGRSLSR
jgi:hypothetical protein